MNSPHMDYSLAPQASGPVSWLETLLVTGLAIGLGFQLGEGVLLVELRLDGA